MKRGDRAACPVCGKEFIVYNVRQTYCSAKCWRRARTLSGKDHVKNLPAVCVICGTAFLTSRNAKAKTCSPPCTKEYRIKRIIMAASAGGIQWAKAAASAQATPPDAPWAHPMPCPWGNDLFDTLPFEVSSWADPQMDPMSQGRQPT